MTQILDKRDVKSRAAPNRKAFIDRNRDRLKEHVDRLANGKNRSITDIAQKRAISINKKSMEEPEFIYDKSSGKHDYVLSGNDKWINDDKIPIENSKGSGGGNGDEGGEDEFTFELTKEEFIDIYLTDCCLPDLVKERLNRIQFMHYVRAGYCKEGSPCQLDLKKTFENATARKIATKNDRETEPPFLDEIDLRFKYFKQEPKPSKDAVMFCLLDVSGSVTEEMKFWSKKFFILLYLFLEKEHTEVEVIFIRHHSTAKEVTEKEFFYDRDTGGTVISSAYQLVSDIIKERYSEGDTNLYIAQSSDGENFPHDDEIAKDILLSQLLPNIQYLAYIEVCDTRRYVESTWLKVLQEEVTPIYPNVQAREITNEMYIIEAFLDLFKRK